MKVLVVGAGGREHAIVDRLAASPARHTILCAPGNPGTAALATNLPIAVDDVVHLAEAARREAVDLVIVGPEEPLAAGLVDRLAAMNIPAFGPSAAAARIEADKWFAKELMKAQAIPTADARAFSDPAKAEEYIKLKDEPLVVKAVGLAKGKGVTVCYRTNDALDAVDRVLRRGEFGSAGARVVIEELLTGPECSILAIVDGRSIFMLDACQDHKPVDDGDTGPMTGGMGAYCPTPVITPAVLAQVERDILIPAVDGLAREGIDYRGVLYAGLMLTPGGPKVLEFNCRFGDPETQPLMLRWKGDLAEALLAAATGRLDSAEIDFDPRPAVCVVAASRGYPGKPETGLRITGLDRRLGDDVRVYQSATRADAGGRIFTDGGRVLGVTAVADTVKAARDRAYDALRGIQFDGMHFRRDIAHQAI